MVCRLSIKIKGADVIRKLHENMDQNKGVFIMISSLVLMLLSFAFVSNWHGRIGSIENISYANCETASVPIKLILLTLCVPLLYGLWFSLGGGKGRADR